MIYQKHSSGSNIGKTTNFGFKRGRAEKEEDRRHSEKKNLWKLKGTRDNPDIFHGKTTAEEKKWGKEK